MPCPSDWAQLEELDVLMSDSKNLPLLLLVVPCYNEEEVLPTTSKLYLDKVEELTKGVLVSDKSGILFVNDGSKDSTWSLIQGLARTDSRVRGLCLSRNYGHQHALLAGLMEARSLCDVTISIDADGQDDIDAMNEMMAAYHDGCDVVYGVRNNRDSDTFFKRTSAQAFYRLMNGMGVESVYNHADYRLLSTRVLDELAQYEEVNVFLRGMVPLVGFKSTCVYYERHERIAGESHYPLSKMVGLAIDGITSMSIKPIQMISGLGMITALISLIGIIWSVVRQLTGHTVTGWASIIAVICLLSGIQLISLGIIGEYVGKSYMESKHRPRWVVGEREGYEKPGEQTRR